MSDNVFCLILEFEYSLLCLRKSFINRIERVLTIHCVTSKVIRELEVIIQVIIEVIELDDDERF